MLIGSSDRTWESTPNTNDVTQQSRSDPPGTAAVSSGWDDENGQNLGEAEFQQKDGHHTAPPHSQQPKHESVVSYALPPGAARRVVERYSLDDNVQRTPSGGSRETKPTAINSSKPIQEARPTSQQRQVAQSSPGPNLSQDHPSYLLPSTPRHPSLPGAGTNAGSSKNPPSYAPNASISQSPAFNPSFDIPISPKPRAYAQHPTYITPSPAPNSVNPILSPSPPVIAEEVCVECAMRDQDMIDIDVTSPGVWERDSDVRYEELLQREMEEEVTGMLTLDPARPKAKGGRLTEENLKIWLTMVSTVAPLAHHWD